MKNKVKIYILIILFLGLLVWESRSSKPSFSEALTAETINNLNNGNLNLSEKAQQELRQELPAIKDSLMKEYKETSSISSKGQIIFLLGEDNSRETIDFLTETLKEENTYLKKNALISLGRIKTGVPVAKILPLIEEKNENVRMEAVSALGKIKTPAATKFLLDQLKKEVSVGIKTEIVRSIGSIRDKSSVGILGQELLEKNNDKHYKDEIILALGDIGDPLASSYLQEYLEEQKAIYTDLNISKEDSLIQEEFIYTEEILKEALAKLK